MLKYKNYNVMKKFIRLLLIIIVLFSCEKQEPPKPNPVVNEVLPISISYEGKWLLVSGKMYIINLETNENTVYNHFDLNKKTSSLRYDGSLFSIEDIEVDKTTWTFYSPKYIPGTGLFVLNDDTTKKFGFYVTKRNCSIIEHPTSKSNELQLGGSARPISAIIKNHEERTAYFYIQEAYLSINGYNCKSFNELVFKKIEEW